MSRAVWRGLGFVEWFLQSGYPFSFRGRQAEETVSVRSEKQILRVAQNDRLPNVTCALTTFYTANHYFDAAVWLKTRNQRRRFLRAFALLDWLARSFA